MNIVSTFTRLFHDLSVYQEIIHQKIGRSVGSFCLYYLLFSICTAIWINIRFIPILYQEVTSVTKAALQTIPDTAHITIKNGSLTTNNVPEPYILTLPDGHGIPETRLLYIDAHADTDTLASSSALISFGHTNARFTAPDSDTTPQIQTYSDGSFDTDVTGTMIRTGINQFLSFINTWKPLLPLFLILPIFVPLIIVRFVYVAIYALLFTLGSSLFNRKHTFKQFLNLTLYTVLVADTINALIVLTYGSDYSIVFSLAFLGVTLLAYFNLPKGQIQDLPLHK